MAKSTRTKQQPRDVKMRSIAFPRELDQKLVEMAAADERSFNTYIIRILRQHVTGSPDMMTPQAALAARLALPLDERPEPPDSYFSDAPTGLDVD